MSYSLMYVDQSIVDNKVGVAVFGNSVRSTNIVCDGSKHRSTCNVCIFHKPPRNYYL